MLTSTVVMEKAHRLAAAGQDAEMVEYLGGRERHELEESPGLALLYGMAQARLGQHDEGGRWLDLALDQARKRVDHAAERRALNARGALALASGSIDDAAEHFTEGLLAASRDGDLATTGRCSNNMGIVNNLRGRYAEALGSWEIARAAFEGAGLPEGVAECHHNLAIAYREQGRLDAATIEADKAVATAKTAGNAALWAVALRGRAEIRISMHETGTARDEMEQVRTVRNHLADPVREAEDLRVVASLLAAEGEAIAAERALQEVINSALALGLPHLRGEAMRDLAIILHQAGRKDEAQVAAREAKAIFLALGATGEIRNMAGHEWDDDFTKELCRLLEPLHQAQQLADAGRYTELLACLAALPPKEVEESPMLSLLSGIAHGRLGGLVAAWQWAMVALARSRALGDRTTEVRALNVCGAIALERGGINEATQFFMEAQEQATLVEDMTAVGRCANNLGIIANMEGEHARAIGDYTRAIGAYEKVDFRRGAAESQHNIAIAYREEGRLDQALEAAEAAIIEADRIGDRLLKAQAVAGRAEIRIARDEPELAVRDARQALGLHREIQDPVREAEDIRILGTALGLAGRPAEARTMLREAIHSAIQHDRPLLIAIAQRDLAYLLAREGEFGGARELALTARATFEHLRAKAEIRRIDALLGEPDLQRPPDA
jgi:tetratricopeptide (TPR) repeat protein